jgi:hypothetical protein
MELLDLPKKAVAGDRNGIVCFAFCHGAARLRSFQHRLTISVSLRGFLAAPTLEPIKKEIGGMYLNF